MGAKFRKLILVVLSTLSIVLSACVPTTAQNLTLTTDDLGDGWVLDAEKTDLNASYYADRGEDGKAIIGTHTNTNKTIFDPALIESVSMRGFSQPDQNLVLFLIVAVFKETSRAEEFAKERFPNAGRDSDIPEENYTYQEVLIGDESSLVSVWETPGEPPPVASNLSFRKGRVWVELISVGQWDDLSDSPPVSEERLEELARIVEARIS